MYLDEFFYLSFFFSWVKLRMSCLKQFGKIILILFNTILVVSIFFFFFDLFIFQNSFYLQIKIYSFLLLVYGGK